MDKRMYLHEEHWLFRHLYHDMLHDMLVSEALFLPNPSDTKPSSSADDMLVSGARFLPNPSDTKTEFVRG